MRLAGAVPARIPAFRDDPWIDDDAYRSGLEDLVSTPGVTAIRLPVAA